MLEEYEGLLVSTQGVVQSIDTQAGNIIISDESGQARVHINGYIGGGQSGEAVGAWANRIKVGDTLSVVGLAAEDAAGKRIRVRNTDEVIVVDASTETPDNGGTTIPDNGGTTTPGNGGNNNGSNQSSETPETGYGQLFGWFAAGMAFIIAGYVAYTTNKRKNESK